jgi:hypothetical protein
MRSRDGTRKWKRGTTSQQIMENPYALGVLHALNVCDTVRTLLDVRNPTREPLDLIPTPHGVSIAHKAVGFSPGSVLTAFLFSTPINRTPSDRKRSACLRGRTGLHGKV